MKIKLFCTSTKINEKSIVNIAFFPLSHRCGALNFNWIDEKAPRTQHTRAHFLIHKNDYFQYLTTAVGENVCWKLESPAIEFNRIKI